MKTAAAAEAPSRSSPRRRAPWTIFPPSEPIVAVIDGEPSWRRLCADKFAVVQVRQDAPGAEGLRQGN
jgi:hypothetical protein